MLISNLEAKYSDRVESIEVGNRKVVKSFGNLEKEYKAIREGMMFYDCSTYGIFSVEGDSADSFLEELATKEIEYLNIDTASECYFLDEEAHIVGFVYIVRKEEEFLVITPWEHADKVKAWLETRATEDIVIKELTGEIAALSMEGPMSWKVVQKVFDAEVEMISLRMCVEMEWNGEKITILRVGRSSEYGYMILGSTKAGEMVYDALLEQKGQWEFPIEESGMECLELSMLEVHQPNLYRETEEFGNVLELCQQWFIQYTKEDFVGREKVMNLFEEGVSKKAIGFLADVETCEKHSKVYLNDECIGQVVYAFKSIKLNKMLGIAILDEVYAQANLEFEVEATDGSRMAIETASAPYIRPLSWDLKME